MTTALTYAEMTTLNLTEQQELLRRMDETMTGRRAAGTHHVWSFRELVVRLTRLEAPGHRGPGADHLAGLEGASQDSFGAVLNNHLRVGMDIDGRRWFCHCKRIIINKHILKVKQEHSVAFSHITVSTEHCLY